MDTHHCLLHASGSPNQVSNSPLGQVRLITRPRNSIARISDRAAPVAAYQRILPTSVRNKNTNAPLVIKKPAR
jgi:hypothetical protein